MLLRVAVVTSLLVSHARAETVKAPACGPPPEKPKPIRTVRDVDWCNTDVGGGFMKGKLREGHSSVHLYADIGEPHDTLSTTLRGIVYGDLDGDKRLEAALVLESSTWIGRTGDHSGGMTVAVFVLERGKPVRLGSIPAGTPVRAVRIAKGTVTVTSGPDTARTTQRYRFDKTQDDFVEIKSAK